MMTRPKLGVASAPAILPLALLLSACAPPSAAAIASPLEPSETPLTMSAATDPAPESPPIGFTQGKSSLPACSASGVLQDSRLNADSQDWLVQEVAELADRLPGFLAGFLKEGIQFGAGGLTSLQGAISGLIDEEVSPGEAFIEEGDDAASGFRFYLAAPPLQPEGVARLVLVISSSQPADTSGGDGETHAPAPPAPYSAPPGPSASVHAEVLDTASGLWIPICEDVVLPANTADASATELPTGNVPIARVLHNARCRHGPAAVFNIVTYFSTGDLVQIVGRNQGSTWWQVSLAPQPGLCWIAGNLVEPLGPTAEVPIVISPPLPTDTEVPSPGGSQRVGCFYLRVCNPFPCGPNTPGGVPCYY